MLLTTKKAAEYLQCSVSYLAHLRKKDHGIRFNKRLGRVLYDTNDLDRWRAEGDQTSTVDTPGGRRHAVKRAPTMLRSECKQISQRAVLALEAGTLLDDDGNPVSRLTDQVITGFFARRLPSGTVTFGFQYGPRHPRRFKSLGVFGRTTVAEARDAARRLSAMIKPKARDPVVEYRRRLRHR
jgi:hypothetical protein